MLRIAVLLENPLKEKVKSIITEVMEKNVVNYYIQEKCDEKTTFVFVDQYHLENIKNNIKIIFVGKTNNLTLANYNLFECVELKNLENVINNILDYYYDTYYFELGKQGFELNDIVYLSFENLNKMKIQLNTNEVFEYEIYMIISSLPKMFKNIDDYKYVNMMYVTIIDDFHFKTTLDDKIQVSKFNLSDKNIRKSSSKIEISDYYSKENIVKARNETILYILIIILLASVIFLRMNKWYFIIFVILFGFFIYKTIFLGVLGSKGGYLRLDENGIYMNDALRTDERYRYAMSILNGELSLRKIALYDLREVRMGYVEKLSAINARFLNYNDKSYQLTLTIDTALEEFSYRSEENWVFGTEVLQQEKNFLNGLYLLNVPIKESKMYRYALNDPNISFKGYMNMVKWKESIESK